MRKTLTTALPAVLAGLLAAACSGPASELRGVVHEARDRVDALLDAYDRAGDPEERAAEALAALEPCPAEYERPPMHTSGPPPFEGEVERPSSLPAPEDEADELREHRGNCRTGERVLGEVPRQMARMRAGLEDYAYYADALERGIGAMSTDQAAQIAAEVHEAASDGADDTLGARYAAVDRGVQRAAAEVREMYLAAGFAGTRLSPDRIPRDPDALEALAEPWTRIIEERARAAEFLAAWNGYQRRLYEGPDAEDPDLAAPRWDPPTGRWTGRYRNLDILYDTTPQDFEITIRPDGGASVEYLADRPRDRCRGELEDGEPSGAGARTVTYRERITGGTCSSGAEIVLERTGRDRMRYRSSSGYRGHAGELTRENPAD